MRATPQPPTPHARARASPVHVYGHAIQHFTVSYSIIRLKLLLLQLRARARTDISSSRKSAFFDVAVPIYLPTQKIFPRFLERNSRKCSRYSFTYPHICVSSTLFKHAITKTRKNVPLEQSITRNELIVVDLPPLVFFLLSQSHDDGGGG